MFRTKPAHLTDAEYNRITTLCHGFQILQSEIEHVEMVTEHLAEDNSRHLRLEEVLLETEECLKQRERSAIRMRDLSERKAVEKECKEARARLIKVKEDIAGFKERSVALERSRDLRAEIVQHGVIDKARDLVQLCEGVRRRREIQFI